MQALQLRLLITSVAKDNKTFKHADVLKVAREHQKNISHFTIQSGLNEAQRKGIIKLVRRGSKYNPSEYAKNETNTVQTQTRKRVQRTKTNAVQIETGAQEAQAAG